MARVVRVLPAALFVLAACASVTAVDATSTPTVSTEDTTTSTADTTASTSVTGVDTTAGPPSSAPTSILAADEAESQAAVAAPTITTPDPLADPPRPFAATIDPFEGAALERSTWQPRCPVAPDDLRLLTLHHWKPDGTTGVGELVVHADWAEEIVGVFAQLYSAGFPIEEMRITTPSDVAAPPDDDNHTTAFVCRAVTGGTTFSQHAYGLAIDINPLWNPYLRNGILIPPDAGPWLDRSNVRPGMIVEGDAVVAAFDAIGWGWGGRWTSLDDWQHFSANGR